jgi:DNA topoisomerase I
VTDAAAKETGHGRLTGKSRNGATPHAIALAKRLGLQYVTTDALSIRRRRSGRGWIYIGNDRQPIQNPRIVRRLARLAVPPAYQDVLYAADPAAHLQAVGRDAAGRLQYRYHPQWEDVRESRKARRLARLAHALPQVRRSIGQYLAADQQTREFACAAVIELVACSAIRPGGEDYRRLHGTRGAATLLKSNVSIYGEAISLRFRSKGGKIVTKEFAAPRLARVITLLRRLPGRRLFQYRAESGTVRGVTAREVNAFLREIAGVKISLKDFRTLLASASVLEALARIKLLRAPANAASRYWRPSAQWPRISPTRRRFAAGVTYMKRWSPPSRMACWSASHKRSEIVARQPGERKCWRRSSRLRPPVLQGLMLLARYGAGHNFSARRPRRLRCGHF